MGRDWDHLRRGFLLVDPTRKEKKRIRLRGGISDLTPDKPMAARQYFSSMSQANITKLFPPLPWRYLFRDGGGRRHSWGKGWVAVEIGGAGGFEERENGWMDGCGRRRWISMVSISVPCENSLGGGRELNPETRPNLRRSHVRGAAGILQMHALRRSTKIHP